MTSPASGSQIRPPIGPLTGKNLTAQLVDAQDQVEFTRVLPSAEAGCPRQARACSTMIAIRAPR